MSRLSPHDSIPRERRRYAFSLRSFTWFTMTAPLLTHSGRQQRISVLHSRIRLAPKFQHLRSLPTTAPHPQIDKQSVLGLSPEGRNSGPRQRVHVSRITERTGATHMPQQIDVRDHRKCNDHDSLSISQPGSRRIVTMIVCRHSGQYVGIATLPGTSDLTFLILNGGAFCARLGDIPQ
jgi:hypothetical protein